MENIALFLVGQLNIKEENVTRQKHFIIINKYEQSNFKHGIPN